MTIFSSQLAKIAWNLCDILVLLNAQCSIWRKHLKLHFLCLSFTCGFVCDAWKKKERKVLNVGNTCMNFTIMMWSWECLKLGFVTHTHFLILDFPWDLIIKIWMFIVNISCLYVYGIPPLSFINLFYSMMSIIKS